MESIKATKKVLREQYSLSEKAIIAIYQPKSIIIDDDGYPYAQQGRPEKNGLQRMKPDYYIFVIEYQEQEFEGKKFGGYLFSDYKAEKVFPKLELAFLRKGFVKEDNVDPFFIMFFDNMRHHLIEAKKLFKKNQTPL